ncbi:hypothetical protein [Shewanella algae]|uniref:hypothetical protein n=1 Tax=Shewanella algae TaxID=38313 RepID=UPI0030046C1C
MINTKASEKMHWLFYCVPNKLGFALSGKVFDEGFLAERIAKQQDWSNKGIRTGSGGSWGSIRSIGGLPVPKEGGSTSGSKAKKTKSPKNKGLSPHAAALATLAKRPELRTGGIINGRKFAASHEHWEQVMLFDWLERFLPEYYLDFAAVPNAGKRTGKESCDMPAEGLRTGYPDITGDVAKGAYHGIFIEMKWGKNKPSEKQVEQLNRKRKRGYFACICYGFDEAKAVITEYLGLNDGAIMTWNRNEELWVEAA